MLVVDASCLYAVVASAPGSEVIRNRLAREGDLVAPHIIDVEVLSVIHDQYRRGRLDRTAAELAVEAVRDWPGERIDHRALLWRGWELRDNVRGWDAMYVALAETIGAPVVTTDGRLARSTGPRCRFELIALGS